ncbi:uncharacterized protein LOC133529510 [Cydia pomonella]|uniref:uncharacterized protein LOC133529510 n=1 Tax=Cydia pomonella TaxID=82600 RepID=UPI002ADD830A|nr:uncharacterized protein LOC133529510 [Cydia pomonella]
MFSRIVAKKNRRNREIKVGIYCVFDAIHFISIIGQNIGFESWHTYLTTVSLILIEFAIRMEQESDTDSKDNSTGSGFKVTNDECGLCSVQNNKDDVIKQLSNKTDSAVPSPKESCLNDVTANSVITEELELLSTDRVNQPADSLVAMNESNNDIISNCVGKQFKDGGTNSDVTQQPEERSLGEINENNNDTITHCDLHEDLKNDGENSAVKNQPEERSLIAMTENNNNNDITAKCDEYGDSSVVTKQPGRGVMLQNSGVPNKCCDCSCWKCCNCSCNDIACFQTAQACAECLVLVFCVQVCMICFKSLLIL